MDKANAIATITQITEANNKLRSVSFENRVDRTIEAFKVLSLTESEATSIARIVMNFLPTDVDKIITAIR